VLQLGAAASLVAACAGEVRAYRRGLEEAAVAEERRRMARDLHDGLVQELAFIASQSKDIAAHSDEDRFELIAASAQRALDDSRVVVGALGRASGQPLRASITLQAHEFARRWGLNVRVAVADEMNLGPDKERAILRIVGEALSNAARHANATTVDIEVANRNGHAWIAVSDDGRGFDAVAAEAAERGFGLRSMRERAELVGGDLRLESQPGIGTRVEIALS
jgi:signal transduction histidine kinase